MHHHSDNSDHSVHKRQDAAASVTTQVTFGTTTATQPVTATVDGGVGGESAGATTTVISDIAHEPAYFDATGGRLPAPSALGVISPPAVVESLSSHISVAAPSVLSKATSLVGLAAAEPTSHVEEDMCGLLETGAAGRVELQMVVIIGFMLGWLV